MLVLAYPWALLLMPLPALVWWFAPPYREIKRGLRVPFLDKLSRLTGQSASDGAVVRSSSLLEKVVLVIIWTSIVIAVARPQRLEEPLTRTLPARDMLLAVDLSGSMETADMLDDAQQPVSRLDAVKATLDDFLTRRAGDRVGLIFFGNAPFLQAPFTEDLETCRILLQEAQVRMAGPRTMLGDAIGKSVHVFEESELEDQVLILLTDGNDTGSLVPPVKAAEIARDQDIVIHTIAFGSPQAIGEEAFDEETLKQIASTTGGSYFFASDAQELEGVYEAIDRIHPVEADSISHRPVTDLFHLPLAAAFLLSLITTAGRKR